MGFHFPDVAIDDLEHFRHRHGHRSNRNPCWPPINADERRKEKNEVGLVLSALIGVHRRLNSENDLQKWDSS
jgi:hypothetical protein